MSVFAEVPAVSQEDVEVAACQLVVEPLGTADDAATAWGWLPADGEGVVVLTDKVTRYDASTRPSRLLSAEVAQGNTTWVVRLVGGHYQGWRWAESPASPDQGGQLPQYRVVRRSYLSSERPDGRGDHHLYSHYWRLVDDEGIQVYKPCGARFAGFDRKGGR